MTRKSDENGGERKKRQLSPAELEQRRNAAEKAKLAATGPKTDEGKAASSRNAWKHGLYSAAAKASEWKALGMPLVRGRPCRTTCPKHPDNAHRRPEYPCSLVLEGHTQAGGDCLDAAVYVEAFDAIMSSMQSGDVSHVHGMLASQVAQAMDVLQQIRELIAEEGILQFIPHLTKEGEFVTDPTTGKQVGRHVVNPALAHYTHLLDKLGINLPELMATPKAAAKAGDGDDGEDAVAELFERIGRAVGGRRGRTIDGTAERE